MADLSLTVDAPGAGHATAEIDRLGGAVSRTGSSWDSLKRKLGSGEVLRNAAASAALLTAGAGDSTQKIAALGGALASIPGPLGLIASGVAVGATALDVFSKSAEAAEKAVAELAATLANLGKQKVEAQATLAGRISGAAVRLGKDIRGFNASGGSAEDLATAQRLTPGDAAGGLKLATQLSSAGLNDEQRKLAQQTLNDVRAAGGELSKEVVARVISGIKYETEAATGPTKDDPYRREQGANRLGRLLDAMGTGLDTRPQALEQGNRALFTQSSVAMEAALQRSEAPAVAAAAASTRDALGAGGAVAMEALRVATDKETNATAELTKAIVDLTGKIDAATGAGGGAAKQADSAWVDAAFAYGRGRASP